MMCSARELGLGEDHAGLLILPEDLPIGADVKPLLGLDDTIYEIEVTPNRGDWASMLGVARELAAYYGRPLRRPEVVLTETGAPAAERATVQVEDAERCPRYMARVLENVRLAPSPPWLQQRLRAAGQRPINNVVDITNYVLLETGHPLHAFDQDRLAQRRIVVRRATPGERMHTLDEQERALEAWMLVIADAETPQALAGIMGGMTSEVTETTTNVLLESAYFEPTGIRKTSRKLGLTTESSQRFQRGADPEMAAYALDRAAALMQELAQAEVAPGVVDAYPAPIARPEVTLRYDRSNALLGVEVPADEQRGYLERLGFAVQDAGETACTLTVPTWRPDVTREADLIEEVARLYGYDRVPVALPRVRPVEQRFAPEEALLTRLRQRLVAMGLTEFFSWTFSNPGEVARAQLPEAQREMVALQNPLSENQATMRSSLVPGLLASTARNLNHGNPDVAAFELGAVYRPPREPGALPEQRTALGLVLCGNLQPHHWATPARPADFYDLRGYAEDLADFLGAPLTVEAGESGLFQPGQSADVTMGKARGCFGKVDPGVAAAFDLEADAYLLELDLTPLLLAQHKPTQFAAIPPYPATSRDLALVVDKALPAAQLLATAQKAGGKHLRDVHVFDVYTGEPVPAGRKSVALRLRFQSPEKTLTDKDASKATDKVLQALEKQFGTTQR